jgi:hypothetical protein
MLRLRRQLVGKFRPLGFDHGPHLVRNMIEALDMSMYLCNRFRSAGIMT